MPGMQELLTVQLGSLSNNLGAQYWYLLETNLPPLPTSHRASSPPAPSTPLSIDPYALFHASSPSSRLPPLTPRLQLLDLPATFSALPPFHALTSRASSDSSPSSAPQPSPRTWTGGPTQIYHQDPISQTSTATTFWSSQWTTPLHPRSLTPLPMTSKDAMQNVDWDDIYENGLRYFVEACDTVGGLQFIGDLYSDGKRHLLDKLCSNYSIYLRDELGRRIPFIFIGALSMEDDENEVLSLFSSKRKEKDVVIADAIADVVVEAEAMFVPVQGWKSQQSIRRVAMALDGMTVPVRIVGGGLRMGDMMERLGGARAIRKATVAGLAVRFDGDGMASDGRFLVSPWVVGGSAPLTEFVSVRGVNDCNAVGWEKKFNNGSTCYRLNLWEKVKIPRSWIKKNELEQTRGEWERVDTVCFTESNQEQGRLLKSAALCLRSAGSKYEDQAEILEGRIFE